MVQIWSTKLLPRAILTLIGMSGLRLDLGHRLLRVILFVCGALLFWLPLFLFVESPTTRAIAGGIFAWIYYYGGMTLTFQSGLSKYLIDRFGEEKAYMGLTVFLGLGFFHQSFAQTVVISAFANTLNIGVPFWAIQVLGFSLTIIGLTTKLWATLLTGLDTYYYKDLFVRHVIEHQSAEGYINSGPYRYFANPMYGVGNLQAYGTALVGQSLEGLCIAFTYQATIYLFYYFVEKPFFVKAYTTKSLR